MSAPSPPAATEAHGYRPSAQTGTSTRLPPLRVERALLVVATAIFVSAFHYAYTQVVVPVYGYMGHTYDAPPLRYMIVVWVLALIPSMWMPLRLVRPSLLLFYAQYFILYIPTLFVVHYTTNPVLTPQEGLQINLLTFAGISLLQVQYVLPLARIRRFPIRDAWSIMVLTTTVLFAFVVLTLRANFRLANFVEIYDVRAAMHDMVLSTGSSLPFYALTWLAGFFLPFLFAVAAPARRWGLLVMAGSAYVFLFGVSGTKSTLAAIVFLPAMYVWIRFARRHASALFAMGLSVLCMLPSQVARVAPEIGKWAIAIVNSRTFGSQPLALAQYYAFFKTNPVTYMSHAGIINMLVPYPYEERVSILIGRFAGSYANANAGFWAADGIGGFGPWGIILMSAIVAGLFWFLDSLSRPFDPKVVTVMLSFISLTFTNGSLSMTMLSGGFGLLLAALFILPNRGVLRVAFRRPNPG